MTIRKLCGLMPVVLAMTGGGVQAQGLPGVIVSGLAAPMKMLPLDSGVILVAESGIGPNTGRVSMVSSDGARVTIIDGLPSGPSAPNNDPDGVTALVLRNRTLFIAIGEGDSAVRGPVAGTAVPNPAPSSPLFSAVLALEFDRPIEIATGGFTVTRADHAALAGGTPVSLTNRAGQAATLRLVVDISDYQFEPVAGVPNNVRLSHPFGLELAGSCGLWLVDAGRNVLGQVDTCRNTYTVLVSFPQFQNPLPTGARLIDAVPTSVHAYGGDLLVTLLSGAPFPPGVAEVRRVKPPTGSSEPFFAGLRMLLDVLPYPNATDGFFVLQYSQDPSTGAPGQVLWFDSPLASPVVVTDRVVSPTSMAIDPRSGNLLVSEITTGRIVSVSIRR